MAVATKKTEPLSDEQLAELLALAKESDSVELKLTVPDSDQRSAITALELDPLEAQVRQVFFFDTPDLALNQQGVVVRAAACKAATTTRWSSSGLSSRTCSRRRSASLPIW